MYIIIYMACKVYSLLDTVEYNVESALRNQSINIDLCLEKINDGLNNMLNATFTLQYTN